ncbi:alpha/beta fold hydrolase [Streptomyces sp. TRM 70361]|uniref:alpha/beta fold hydrolase n=1 Tax=Streptomyces sp. TRM 70361 TaxID=3116553 RepID=UPI002E7AC8EC|nr:alpha/beta fold hydrolase [Streptomyces sp. TRM 70361]MEE1939866.1 alpha/beta fold hydrolase [Streptomyces sp. TRM 70361]
MTSETPASPPSSVTASVYRDDAARRAVREWCADRLGRWPAPHRTLVRSTGAGDTHVLVAGAEAGRADRPAVVLVPGTNFGAAACLPLAAALAARGPVYVPDLPGQPGLSAPGRPRRNRTAWYGRWLAEVLDGAVGRPAVAVGHSLGGAAVLACDSPHLVGRVALSPAGLVRLRVTGRVLGATLPWLLRPDEARSAALLRVMSGPGAEPSAELAEWMTLVARNCRSTLAPPPLPRPVAARCRRVPAAVAVGEHDVFLPPRRLVPAAGRLLGVRARVLPGAGHLLPEERPEELAALVDEVVAEAVDAARRRGTADGG